MVVLRDPGEVYVLCHSVGPDAVGWVERIDPVTLEPVARSIDLPAGPVWPGGLAAHANGSLYVVFGRYAHRLDADLAVLASCRLPRDRPYNSFVVLADGHLVTKDFGGVLPGEDPDRVAQPCELVVLEPDRLDIVETVELAEPSIARLSSDGDNVVVVGVSRLVRAAWDGERLTPDEAFDGRYLQVDGQTYGWDPVIALGAACGPDVTGVCPEESSCQWVDGANRCVRTGTRGSDCRDDAPRWLLFALSAPAIVVMIG